MRRQGVRNATPVKYDHTRKYARQNEQAHTIDATAKKKWHACHLNTLLPPTTYSRQNAQQRQAL